MSKRYNHGNSPLNNLNSGKKPTLKEIKSRMKMRGTGSLNQEIAQELDTPDPPAEQAEQYITAMDVSKPKFTITGYTLQELETLEELSLMDEKELEEYMEEQKAGKKNENTQ